MSLGGWQYQMLSPQVDETPLPDEDGMEYVKRLAQSKALAAASQAQIEGVIVAADTTVVYGQAGEKPRIFGKPVDTNDAARMLKELRNHVHQVHTAVSILFNPDGNLLSDLCTTDVWMRDYNDEEIEAYIASGDPMDKAGAYAIQHPGFHPVEKLDGCFANVMGLPLCHVTCCLARLGITPQADITQACQVETGAPCAIYQKIVGEQSRVY